MEKLKILIADDHPIVRDGLKSILSIEPDYLVIGEAEDGKEAYEKVSKLKPDIVILDIAMPRLSGIQVTEHIKKAYPKTKVLILSMHKQKEYLLRSLRAGADGFILKDQASDRLLEALIFLRANKHYICPDVAEYLAEEYMQYNKTHHSLDPFDSLSLREKEVISLIIEGNTSTKIASLLNINLSTVKSHRHSIMKKLEIHEMATLVKIAIKKGFNNTID